MNSYLYDTSIYFMTGKNDNDFNLIKVSNLIFNDDNIKQKDGYIDYSAFLEFTKIKTKSELNKKIEDLINNELKRQDLNFNVTIFDSHLEISLDIVHDQTLFEFFINTDENGLMFWQTFNDINKLEQFICDMINNDIKQQFYNVAMEGITPEMQEFINSKLPNEMKEQFNNIVPDKFKKVKNNI